MLNQILGKRKYFKLLFILYVFINTLALGYFGIDFNPLSIVVLVYGIFIFVYNVIKKDIFYTNNHLLLISLYGILLFVATYFNKTYSTMNSFMIAIMQLFIFILIFAQPKSMTLKTLKQELHTIIPFTCFLVGSASLISLFMYFLNISGSQNGWYIGLVADRLFGVYFNCNPASFLAIIVILMSMIAIKNHYEYSFLYMINIGIQLSYIILTQCRAAIIILAVILTAVAYYRFFRVKELSTFKRISLNIGICLCMLLGTKVIQEVAFMIPQIQGAQEESDSRFQLAKIKEIVALTMTGQLQNIPKIITLADEVSSGRITLAKDSLKVWQQSPIQGVGAGNFRDMLIDVSHDDNWGQQILHSHNVFMETLVTAGILGCFLFVLFFIKTLFVSRDILLKYRNKKSYFIVLLFIMIFVSEFIGGLFDFGVFYVYSLSATLAWLFLGYIYWLNDQSDMSLIDDSETAVFNKYELLSIVYHKEELESLKPEFEIIESSYHKHDYVMKVKYYLGQSSFTYNVYYTLYDQNDDLDKRLARDFYSLIEDEIKGIYNQSHIK